MGRFNTSPSRNDDRRDNRDDADWKAACFVNVYLPYQKADGTVGKYKLGKAGLPITEAGNDAKLAEMFKKDPESFQKMLAAKVIIEVQSAEKKATIDFASALAL